MSKKILLVDHEDSFTMNISGLLSIYGANVDVVPSMHADMAAARGGYSGIVLSPGPGSPEAAVGSIALLRKYAHQIPILGICLGHQIIGYAYGATIICAGEPVHGYTSSVYYEPDSLFSGMPNPCTMMRYHSLVLDGDTIPAHLHTIARTDSGEVMAIRHKTYNLAGVQFHPESIGSVMGGLILKNWLGSL